MTHSPWQVDTPLLTQLHRSRKNIRPPVSVHRPEGIQLVGELWTTATGLDAVAQPTSSSRHRDDNSFMLTE